MSNAPAWLTLPLDQLTREQWESLCDGCARCCVVHLEDEETGEIFPTAAACTLLDRDTCRCSDYAHRHERVPECVVLTPRSAGQLAWIPPTCAYRLRAEGRSLPGWHPLQSGRAESVHEAGISVLGRTVPSEQVHPDDLEMMRIEWGESED